jgi:hypothetical protein
MIRLLRVSLGWDDSKDGCCDCFVLVWDGITLRTDSSIARVRSLGWDDFKDGCFDCLVSVWDGMTLRTDASIASCQFEMGGH